MSLGYKAISWNKQKKHYDMVLWLGILLFIASYVVAQLLFQPGITAETLIIRSTGLSAIILLHIILLIGPLCRIHKAFLPLLYNRRHMGVSMFFLALIHGIFSIIQFHFLGNIGALESLFLSNQNFREISEFPFEILGFFALIILLFMAVTSHDFWLKNLKPQVWKTLHMMVYFAYALLIMHIALGALQYEGHFVNWLFLTGGFLAVAGAHLYTGYKEYIKTKLQKTALAKDGFVKIVAVKDIPDDCAKTCFVEGENIAIFKHNNTLSAVSNVCKHQMGPLGEGKIIDGCITCPWHGYQYQPADGKSPPPFEEKIATYAVKVLDNMVWVNPTPNEEGTYVEPTKIQSNE